MTSDLVGVAARYYTTLQDTASEPRDYARLEQLIHPDCACNDVVELLKRLARDQHHLEFAIVTSQARVTKETARSATVFIQVRQSAGREVDASGAPVRTLPASTGTYALDLTMDRGEWLVHRITRTT